MPPSTQEGSAMVVLNSSLNGHLALHILDVANITANC